MFNSNQLPKPGGKDINLIIAVSFGLFVPPRLLDAVRYGGLNVHPSLLPEYVFFRYKATHGHKTHSQRFRGPAPLHRTLLSGCRRTGVTLQTLHPKNFDHGVILDQTSYPGFEHNSQNVDELKSITGQRGAEMLVQSIQKRTFVPPLRDVGWCNGNETAQSLRRAPKITTEDRHINWGSWSAAEILKRQQIIGPLWSIMEGSVGGQGHEKRIIWAQGFELAPENVHIFSRAGHPVIFAHHSKFPQIFIRTCDGITLTVNKIKIEGRRSSDAISSMVYAGMLTLPEDINKSSYQPTASISPLR